MLLRVSIGCGWGKLPVFERSEGKPFGSADSHKRVQQRCATVDGF
jgi:hypothetical protein